MKLSDLQKTATDTQSNSFYLSFSDLMVLLCVFFIMLISISEVETFSFEKIKTSFTGSTDGTLAELGEKLKTLSINNNVRIELDKDGLRMNLEVANLFESASAKLKDDALKKIHPLLEEIKNTGYKIDVEGHTDDRRLFYISGGSVETNWSLSGRRASTVVLYLLQMGFNKKRLRVVGYASNKPISNIENKSGHELAEARAQNRRVSLLVR